MKLIAENGEVLLDLPEDAAVIALKPDGSAEMVMPNLPEDDEEVPDYILLAGGMAAMAMDDHGSELIRQFMDDVEQDRDDAGDDRGRH